MNDEYRERTLHAHAQKKHQWLYSKDEVSQSDAYSHSLIRHVEEMCL